MATAGNVDLLDAELIDLSEDDKIAAKKYLSENGIRGLEGFLAERLDVWRKWFVDCSRCVIEARPMLLVH
jgi:hypothetical protein